MPSSTDPVSTRTYEVEYTPEPSMYGTKGSVSRTRITIPETWKVTFGPVVGAGKAVGLGNTLRVWESDTKQRLLISGVLSFRDISIPVTIAAVRAYGQTTWHVDNGSWTGEHAEKVEKRWVSVDEISEIPLSPDDLKDARPDGDTVASPTRSWRNPPRKTRAVVVADAEAGTTW